MKMILAALSLVLTGCAAQPIYNHPTKNQADFARDSYECEQSAWQHAANMGAPGNPLIARDAYHDCMTRKHGYTLAPKPTKT
mgnify:CR=1 FL=1